MTAPYRIRRPSKGVTLQEAESENDLNSYLDRLIKMIPAEVVALYLVGSGIIPENDVIPLVIWTVFCFGCVVALRAYGTADSRNKEPPDWIHVTISSIAFVIWVYTLGGPFASFDLVVPYIGSLFVLGWTFFVPIIYKGPSQS